MCVFLFDYSYSWEILGIPWIPLYFPTPEPDLLRAEGLNKVLADLRHEHFRQSEGGSQSSTVDGQNTAPVEIESKMR